MNWAGSICNWLWDKFRLRALTDSSEFKIFWHGILILCKIFPREEKRSKPFRKLSWIHCIIELQQFEFCQALQCIGMGGFKILLFLLQHWIISLIHLLQHMKWQDYSIIIRGEHEGREAWCVRGWIVPQPFPPPHPQLNPTKVGELCKFDE